MTSPGDSRPEEAPRIEEELARIPYEPLLPAEKKLIVASLGLGILLLAVLWWISQRFFSG